MKIEYASGIISAKLETEVRELVFDVDFCIDSAKTLALIGETGAGKTLVACSIMRLLPSNVVQNGGKLALFGESNLKDSDVKKMLGKRIVYIPQSGHECLNSSMRVKGQIYDALKLNCYKRADFHDIAVKKLADVGFDNPDDILQKYPFELSGGMAQRVVIAIATCSRAELVIADEPTNGVDKEHKIALVKLINDLFPDAARLFITHDISLARLCDDILVLSGGRVLERGNSKSVLDNPRHPYTRALISSLAKNGLNEIPVLREQKGDCPFYSRCSIASADCLKGIKLNKIEDKEWRCNAEN